MSFALWMTVFTAAMTFVFSLKTERFDYFLFHTLAFAASTATAVLIAH